MISIKLNGQDWQLPAGTSISELLGRLKISPKACVVEVNDILIERAKFSDIKLKPADQVEVIRMMGGG